MKIPKQHFKLTFIPGKKAKLDKANLSLLADQTFFFISSHIYLKCDVISIHLFYPVFANISSFPPPTLSPLAPFCNVKEIMVKRFSGSIAVQIFATLKILHFVLIWQAFKRHIMCNLCLVRIYIIAHINSDEDAATGGKIYSVMD